VQDSWETVIFRPFWVVLIVSLSSSCLRLSGNRLPDQGSGPSSCLPNARWSPFFAAASQEFALVLAPAAGGGEPVGEFVGEVVEWAAVAGGVAVAAAAAAAAVAAVAVAAAAAVAEAVVVGADVVGAAAEAADAVGVAAAGVAAAAAAEVLELAEDEVGADEAAIAAVFAARAFAVAVGVEEAAEARDDGRAVVEGKSATVAVRRDTCMLVSESVELVFGLESSNCSGSSPVGQCHAVLIAKGFCVRAGLGEAAEAAVGGDCGGYGEYATAEEEEESSPARSLLADGQLLGIVEPGNQIHTDRLRTD
jgi:hypothetical protein